MEPKFKEGDIVFAKENPTLKLIVRRFIDEIYFCKIANADYEKDKVYFERELIGSHDIK